MDARISFFGPEARTKLQGWAVGQPDTMVNASQFGSVGTKLSLEWDHDADICIKRNNGNVNGRIAEDEPVVCG